MLSLLSMNQGRTAEMTPPTASSPTQIVIENALVNTASSKKHAQIHLIATDTHALHENQIYQAHIILTNATGQQDAIYNEIDELIFISALLEKKDLSHQLTLRRINHQAKGLEFAVMEKTSLESHASQNNFFDSEMLHETSLQVPARDKSQQNREF
jgi:hypothetical protein